VAGIVAEAFARGARTGQPIDPPLLLCLDECANVAPLANLDELASTGPGQGVQLLSRWDPAPRVVDPAPRVVDLVRSRCRVGRRVGRVGRARAAVGLL